jgi:antitoxin VapB
MALNIKNEHTVSLVRELADALGTSQTSAIEEAVRARLALLAASGTVTDAEARKRELVAESLARVRRTVADAAALGSWRQYEAEELYDERGLPR